MDRRAFCLAGAAAGFGLLAGKQGRAAEGKWVDLYNGKDLTGWHVKDGKMENWKAEGELIRLLRRGRRLAHLGQGIRRLRPRHRVADPAGREQRHRNPLPRPRGDPAHVGMEIQILDDEAPEYKEKLEPAQYTGGIYYQAAPKAHPAKKPGEWNRYEIRCQGPRIVIHLNGVEIQNVNVEEYTRARAATCPSHSGRAAASSGCRATPTASSSATSRSESWDDPARPPPCRSARCGRAPCRPLSRVRAPLQREGPLRLARRERQAGVLEGGRRDDLVCRARRRLPGDRPRVRATSSCTSATGFRPPPTAGSVSASHAGAGPPPRHGDPAPGR